MEQLSEDDLSYLTRQKLFQSGKCYPVTGKANFGHLLILNNKTFGRHHGDRNRMGSEADVNRMEKAFERLNFKVSIKSDLTHLEMQEALHKFAKNPDHENVNCVAVSIMTHGNQECDFEGVDGKSLNFDADVLPLFSNKTCQNLIGKPKLFFLQTCRGNGINSLIATDNISQKTQPTSLNTCLDDIVVSRSTIPNHESIRHQRRGSWYIQSLCKVLENPQNTNLKEIRDLLNLVSKTMREDFGSRLRIQTGDYTVISMNKKFYFPRRSTTMVQFNAKQIQRNVAAIWACQGGRLETLRSLQEESQDHPLAFLFEIADTNGNTVLHHILGNGHIHIVNWLLTQLDLNFKVTTLTFNNDSDILSEVFAILDKLGLNLKNKLGQLPTQMAAQNGHLRYLLKALQNRFQSTSGFPSKIGNRTIRINCNARLSSDGLMPSIYAAKHGHLEVLQWLDKEFGDSLEWHSTELRTDSTSGQTWSFDVNAMQEAVGNGQRDIVQWLLESSKYSKMDGFAGCNGKGYTMAHLICDQAESQLDLLKIFFGKGRELWRLSIYMICINQHQNLKTMDGKTAAHLAASRGHLDILQWMHTNSNKGIWDNLWKNDVNKSWGEWWCEVDNQGRSILHEAIINHRINVVEWWFKTIGGYLPADTNGDTLYHMALMLRPPNPNLQVDSALDLLEFIHDNLQDFRNGFNPNEKGASTGDTIIHLAIRRGSEEVLEFFRDKYGNVIDWTIPSHKGLTALGESLKLPLKKKRLEITEWLLYQVGKRKLLLAKDGSDTLEQEERNLLEKTRSDPELNDIVKTFLDP